MEIERFEDIEAWQLAREFQDVYNYAGGTRAAIRGFIKHLQAYEQGRRNKSNPEPVNAYKVNLFCKTVI